MSEKKPPQEPSAGDANAPARTLKELLGLAANPRNGDLPQEDAGIAEVLPFPFLALVGQQEMKLALLLAVINPAVGGVLLVGPRGTGKTTAVRSLVDLLPDVERSACHYGCLPEDIESGGMDAVCPECARKYGEGRPLTRTDRVRLVELPLNARLEDVIGGLDELAALNDRMRLKRGILAAADRNILYIDEVNLLKDEIADAILDAAAQGSYTVRRGPVAATYRAGFVLTGSMNPEEGRLRPQMMDRFGLRVVVRGLEDEAERMEAYRRVRAYRENPRQVINDYAQATSFARQEIQTARALLPQVTLPDVVAQAGIALIQRMKIASLRAELTLLESARALAAADNRAVVRMDDLHAVAPIALRMRRSDFMTRFFEVQAAEDGELNDALRAADLESQE